MALGDALRNWLDAAVDAPASRRHALRNCRSEMDKRREVDTLVDDLRRRIPAPVPDAAAAPPDERSA